MAYSRFFVFCPCSDADMRPLPKPSVLTMMKIHLPPKIWQNLKIFHNINVIEDKLSNSCLT